ncbi:MAG: cytochrome C biogenesis protein [Gammaproteobacteria bacterium HGW-Gammaproteobacteria-4]|jgi:cytochrome c-type biogenesis protein CcmH|nr:MAG: cytochrome C biogenesis protein [Gammaproteobacteria bacterium HGW-Gammaproteobacteria-4]
MNVPKWCLRSLGVAVLLFAGAAAAVDPMPFRDAAEEARFRQLTAELRCVMCQNQSLADSSAPIAKDLRREVFDLMREGRSDEEIKVFLVERYTDFVLYKPPLNDRTWWLWFTPALILLAGAITVAAIVRRRAKANTASKPEPEDAW